LAVGEQIKAVALLEMSIQAVAERAISRGLFYGCAE
jgi:hypothetical protein